MAYRVFVSTHPFGAGDRKPLDILEDAGCEVTLNPFGRKLRPEEERELLEGVDGLIAGTERLDEWVLEKAERLRVIARVGVGLDGIDFDVVREKGIVVTYTPQAPALAVAELAVGLILNLARMVTRTDRQLRQGRWNRYMGRRLREQTVGIVGVGRIGRRVAHLLSGFGCRVLGHDLVPDETISDMVGLRWVGRESILRESDFLTLHVPLTDQTYHWVDEGTLAMMKPGACLINTSRGEVVDEEALVRALRVGALGGAAIDVYAEEPYQGPLCEIENIVLTCHMGAATKESRYDMEVGAALDCVRVLCGETPEHPVLMMQA